MRIGAAPALLAALVLSTACSSFGFFRQYEYEEDLYLALDGRATVYVSASVAALNRLRGSSFDTSPTVPIDTDAIRAWFTTPVTRVTRTPTLSRRGNRRYVHVRVAVDDVSKLSQAGPFAWSSYQFTNDGELFVYRQTVGAAAGHDAGDAGGGGGNERELVAFRLHLPSTIVYHNAGPGNPRRGNILVWEQSLADRARGEPLAFDARIESQSILSRTLLLFGAMLVAVGIMFAAIVWWLLRRGRVTRT